MPKLGHAAPMIVVCSSGTSSGTQEMVAGLSLVFTLPYSSGPLGFDASMNCSAQHSITDMILWHGITALHDCLI